MPNRPVAFVVLIAAVFAAHAQQPPAAHAPPADKAAAPAGSFEQRLDALIADLTIEGKPLPEVLAELSQRTGAAIALDPRAVDRLPWGDKTRLTTLTIQETTLRDALPRILQPLALQAEIEEDRVLVLPTAPLDRMDGRASWKELNLLAELLSTPYTAEAFAKLEILHRITSKLDAPALLTEQLARAGRGTIAEVLETATGSLGWAWFVQDEHVVVVTQPAVFARAMARRMTGRYQRRQLGEILFELGREAGVHVHLQPGSFKMLPEQTVQRYSLYLTNVSIRQAFDYIAADTGLAYSIEADGVHVGPVENIEKLSQQGEGASDPYVGKLSVPLGDGSFAFEFLVRESELPKEVRQMRGKALKQLSEAARAAASQPAAARAASN